MNGELAFGDFAEAIVLLARGGQRLSSFVDQIGLTTPIGHGPGGEGRSKAGLKGKSPTLIVADRSVLEPEGGIPEFGALALYPETPQDVVVVNAGWKMRPKGQPTETGSPTQGEFDTLRALHAHTANTHGQGKAA